MASDREMLSQYIQEKEDNVASVLERLGWEKEYLEENVSNMAQCPLDPGHWMPESSLQEHIAKCRLSKAGVDFSAYECPVDTSYCYKDSPSVVQVHVDEACWKAVSAEVARVKMQKQPLLATSREEVGPTAVWLDGNTPGVGGGEGYSACTVGRVGEGAWPTGGPSAVMRGEKLGGNQVKLVPVTEEGVSTLEDAQLLKDLSVPAEYDVVSRSVDERRVMYEHVIAVSKPLVAPSAADASVDQELLSYDFDKEVRKLKRGVEEDDLGQQKSYLQKLAEQRDEKRRRQKYRSKKVYISNKSIKEIYKAIIDKRMAEFGEHSSLQRPSPGVDRHQSARSSHHQRASDGHYQRHISSEQERPAPEELQQGEGTSQCSAGPQSLGKENSDCTEPVCEDSGVVPHFSIVDQNDFNSVEGIKDAEISKRRSTEDVGDVNSQQTLHRHRHKHKHSSRSHSHQRDSGRHKRKKRSYSKDQDSSGHSSRSKRRKEEGGHSSASRKSSEVDGDRVGRDDDGTANKVGRSDNGTGDGDQVGRGDDRTGDDDRVKWGDDGIRDSDRMGRGGNDGSSDGGRVEGGDDRTANSNGGVERTVVDNDDR